ncbi:MAG: sensor histidine kinase [Ruminococcaceae bacterium]|nr:sensor histidine kinase [Oscillospiraceae bacterium]
MLRDISLHIMDLTQNSIRAKATLVNIDLLTDEKGFLNVSIKDNGCGMKPEFLKVVTDPFTTERTTRKVGMGIPFFKLSCETADGNFFIDSVVDEGTVISGSLRLNSIDRIPLGDLGETIKFLIMYAPDVRYVLKIKSCKDEFILDTDEIKETLEDVSILQQEILEWIKEFVNENVSNIFGGVINEVLGRT